MKLVLIDDKIEAEEILINSFKTDCIIKNIKNYQNSMQLISEIENIEEITHFAMVYFFEGSYEIPYFKESGESNYKYFNIEIMNLITLFKGYNSGIKIDIITCNMNDLEFVQTVDILEKDFEIDIRYSLNQTGNNPEGDWILESDQANIKETYFNDLITLWTKTLDLNGPIINTSNSAIYSIKKYGDYIYIGGLFSIINNFPILHLCRINKNSGFVDISWNPQPNSYILTLEIDSSHIYIGGTFSTINGSTSRSRIARIPIDNPIGTVDSLWDPNSNAEVSKIFLTNTHIYIGGTFNLFGSTTRNRITRISKSNTTGIVDSSWNPNSGGPISAIYVDSSFIYLGGNYTQINGSTTRNRISRISIDDISGTVDPSWNPNSDQSIFALQADNDHIYIGGVFSTLNGSTSRNFIARIPKNNSIGTVDPSWNPNLNQRVNSIYLTDNYIYFGGTFTSVQNGSVTRNRIARISKSNLIGSVDSSWNPNSGGEINSIEIDSSNIYLGGGFLTISELNYNNLAIVNDSNGLAINQIILKNFVNFNTTVLTIQTDSSYIYIGGNFSRFNSDLAINRIARLIKETGKIDPSWNPNANNFVYSITFDSNYIYLGGSFTTLNSSTTRNRLARISKSNLTGIVDPSWNPNINNTIYTITIDGSYTYIGGEFDKVNGSITKSRIARINNTDSSGVVDSVWDPSLNSNVRIISIDSSNIYIGGNFTTINNSVTRNRIARISKDDLSGNVDLSWNPSANGLVRDITLDSSNIYIGGDFTNIGGQSRNYIARISKNNTIGTVDLSWNPNSSSSVYSISLNTNYIYLAGFFQTINSKSRNGLARIEKSNILGTVDSSWNPFPETSYVYKIHIDNEDFYTGGSYYFLKNYRDYNFTPTNYFQMTNKLLVNSRNTLESNGISTTSIINKNINQEELISDNFVDFSGLSGELVKTNVRHALINILQENNPWINKFLMPKTNLGLTSGTENINIYIPGVSINLTDSSNSSYVNLDLSGDFFNLIYDASNLLITKTSSNTYLLNNNSYIDGNIVTAFTNYKIKFGGAHIYNELDGGGMGDPHITTIYGERYMLPNWEYVKLLECDDLLIWGKCKFIPKELIHKMHKLTKDGEIRRLTLNKKKDRYSYLFTYFDQIGITNGKYKFLIVIDRMKIKQNNFPTNILKIEEIESNDGIYDTMHEIKYPPYKLKHTRINLKNIEINLKSDIFWVARSEIKLRIENLKDNELSGAFINDENKNQITYYYKFNYS